MATTLEELDTQLGRLSLQAPPTNLSDELSEIGLEIFHPICSLGFFTWRPNSEKICYEKLDTITASDITDSGRLDMNGRPPKLHIPTIQMPYSFRSLASATSFENKFPYGQLECIHLHAATRRGVDWTATDFCIGGSVLTCWRIGALLRTHTLLASYRTRQERSLLPSAKNTRLNWATLDINSRSWSLVRPIRVKSNSQNTFN
jgi:hypothetical protein